MNEIKIDEIKFKKDFNQDISLLPNYITKITFHDVSNFNQQIDFLPKNLTYLSFDEWSVFNQPIDNLPCSA